MVFVSVVIALVRVRQRIRDWDQALGAMEAHLVQAIHDEYLPGVFDDGFADLAGPALIHERPYQRIGLGITVSDDVLRSDRIGRLCEEADREKEEIGFVEEAMRWPAGRVESLSRQRFSNHRIHAYGNLEMVCPCIALRAGLEFQQIAHFSLSANAGSESVLNAFSKIADEMRDRRRGDCSRRRSWRGLCKRVWGVEQRSGPGVGVPGGVLVASRDARTRNEHRRAAAAAGPNQARRRVHDDIRSIERKMPVQVECEGGPEGKFGNAVLTLGSENEIGELSADLKAAHGSVRRGRSRALRVAGRSGQYSCK